MNTNFLYDKMDYYSILEYLKSQAKYWSDGKWTDFSDADIGTVLLKLMAMNADTTNYQVEKGISELYIDTVVERANAIALCKLIGYEPRHYTSALCELTMNVIGSTNIRLEAFNQFTNSDNDISYYNIEEYQLQPGKNQVRVYEGEFVGIYYNKDDITNSGTIILPDYNIGTNTIRVSQGGIVFNHINNALYGENEACYSIHLNSDNMMYIQFPPYYNNFISNSPINVEYLLSSGVEGRVGAEIISGVINTETGEGVAYINEESSEGGYNPETVEEIRNEAPRFASTMNTLVTLNDYRILAKDFVGIADVVALDYNYEESGLIQPDHGQVNDAYKVNLYILPETTNSIYDDEGNYTETITRYLKDVKLKKPNSIQVFPYNVEYVRPALSIRVYMDEYDLRFSTTGDAIKDFLVELYSRYNRKIGQAMFKSHISSEILDEFPYINYLEILGLEGESKGALKVNNLQYIDLIKDNIAVQVVPYSEE